MTAPPSPSSRPIWLLSLGAALGVLLAAYGLLTGAGSDAALPEGSVAMVNGQPIFRDGYERLVAGLDADTREPVTPALRRRVLDRMIDEELLVQRGLELGLAESDRRVRADITQAMIRSVVLEAEDEAPTEEEVLAFYEEEGAFFTQPGRVRVAQVFFRVPASSDEAAIRSRAEEAQARLEAGEALTDVRDALGDREVSPIPDAKLPPTKLREYVGPTALRAAMSLDVGGVSAPVRSGTGLHVFVLQERDEARVPPYAEISAQVRSEWVRRAGDRALRGYLDGLRDEADVVVVQELQ